MGSFQSFEEAKWSSQFGKVVSPLNKMLEDVEWGEFRIGDLFEIGTGSLLSASELSREGSVPRISAKSHNNGVLGYFDTESLSSARHFENFISVNFFGSDGGIFYHPYKASVEMKVHTLKIPGVNLNVKTGSFICSSLYKVLGGFGYGGQLSSSKLKNNDYKIKLPINKNKEIDFDFMESFIAELEAERIAELEAYLSAAGLKDCQLTLEEQQVLDNFENLEWEEYKLETLFEKIKTKKLPFKADELPRQKLGKYTLPCLTSSFNNQGLNYFVPKDGATILKNVISIPSNSDIYRAYFQSNEFTVLSDAYALRWIFDDVDLSPNQYLFAVQSINKVTDLPIYSYKNKLGGWNVVKHKYIQLPVKNEHLDYKTMEVLISALKKLAIKDVVQYADQKIAAHEQVIKAS